MAGTKILGYVVLIFLALTIFQVIFIQMSINDYGRDSIEPTAMASGVASFCLNDPPNNIINGCNFTIPWGYKYYCDGITGNDSYLFTKFTFQSIFLTPKDLFNISMNGTINFTPQKTAIGNHTIRIFVFDDSGCNNNMFYKDFDMSIVKANHPPYLATPIPNKTIKRFTSINFYLGTYFKDPDDDNLTYAFATSNQYVSISVDNRSYATVSGDVCGESNVFFVASDPYGLTTTSNTINYVVWGCAVDTSSSSGGSGSGLGGGGEGSYNCTSEWHCGQWSNCLQDNTTTLECRDYHACDPKHYIEVLKKNCTYVPEVVLCAENWQCNDWGPCINSSHSRICIDNSSCGTFTTKPAETEYCTAAASCFDGIKDGNETGIDCGGECPACKNVEAPKEVPKPFSTSLLIVLILALVFFSLLLFSFRKKISDFLSTINKKKKKKIILLTSVQKERLLQEIYIMQTRYDEGKYPIVYPLIIQFIRHYFKEINGIEHLEKDLLIKALTKIKNKPLEKIMLDFYTRFAQFETSRTRQDMNKFEIQELLDLMMHNIYLVSEFTDKDAILCVKERVQKTDYALDACYLALSNLYIALEFGELSVAKKIYKNLIKTYDELIITDKQRVYPDIIYSFSIIKFIDEAEYT